MSVIDGKYLSIEGLSHLWSELKQKFATAAQGTKADTAVQTIKINNVEQTKTNGTVNLPDYYTKTEAQEYVGDQIKSAVDNLSAVSVGGSGKYISAISESYGIITATPADIQSSVNTSNNAVSSAAVKTYVDNAIGGLDVAEVGGAGGYISAISESNGLISATPNIADTTPTANSTNLVQSKGVKAYVDNAIISLDVAKSGGVGKYIKEISETNGKISTTVENLSQTPSANDNTAISSKGVYPTTAATSNLIDKGAKNLCPYSGFVASAKGTYINDQPINLPAGTYVISYNTTASSGSINFRFLFDGTSVAYKTISNDSAGNIDTEITISSDCNQIRVYTNNATTITNLMICDKVLWDLSNTFVPYRRQYDDLDKSETEDRSALVEVVNKGPKNIINVNFTSVTKNGVTATKNSDGSLTLSGASNSSSDFLLVADFSNVSATSSYTSNIPTIKDKTFICKGSGISSVYVQVLEYNSSSDYTFLSDTSQDKTFTFTKDYVTFRLFVSKSADFTTPVMIYPIVCTLAEWNVSPQFVPYGNEVTPAIKDYVGQEETATRNLVPSMVFSLGTNVNAYNSLDEITTPGNYYAPNGTVAQAVGAPYTDSGFNLWVVATNDLSRQTQILMPNPYGGKTGTYGWFMIRQNIAGTFGTWYKLSEPDKLGTQILATSDSRNNLNNYKTPGNYYISTNSTASYVYNIPTPYAGKLVVEEISSSTNYIRQTYYANTSTTKLISIRRLTGVGETLQEDVWSDWQTIMTPSEVTAHIYGYGTFIDAPATGEDPVPRDMNAAPFTSVGKYSFGSAVAKAVANCPFNRYKVLTTEPSDWSTNYKYFYYTKNVSSNGGTITYSHITGNEAPTFVTGTYYEAVSTCGGTVVVENIQGSTRLRQTGYINDTLAKSDNVYVRFYASSYNGTWSNWFCDTMYGIGKNLIVGDNLNDIIEPGTYYCDTSDKVSGILNTPFTSDYASAAFKLKVEYIQSENNIKQTIIPLYQNSGYFSRLKMSGTSGTWRSWQYYEPLTTEQRAATNSGITAAMLEAIKALLPVNELFYTIDHLKELNTAGSWSGNAYTRYGVTFTPQSDGSVKVSGTCNDSSGAWFKLMDASETGGWSGYTLSGCPSGGSTSKYHLQYAQPTTKNDTGSGVTISSNNGYNVWVVVKSTTAVDLTFYPMVCNPVFNQTTFVSGARSNRWLCQNQQ